MWKISEGESKDGRVKFMRELDRETSNDEMLETEKDDIGFVEARIKAKGNEKIAYN